MGKWVSEWVGFNGASTQFRSLAPSLTRKAGTESPTVKESRRYINLANAYKFRVALLSRRLSIQLRPLRDKWGGNVGESLSPFSSSSSSSHLFDVWGWSEPSIRSDAACSQITLVLVVLWGSWSSTDSCSLYLQGAMRDNGVILLFTSHTQLLTSEKQSSLSATGKRNRLAQFRVHKIASGIRMFESVLFPQQFIRVDEGACDIMVVRYWTPIYLGIDCRRFLKGDQNLFLHYPAGREAVSPWNNGVGNSGGASYRQGRA